MKAESSLALHTKAVWLAALFRLRIQSAYFSSCFCNYRCPLTSS